MKVAFDQAIGAPAGAVQEALVDPSFYASLGELPGISAPELRSIEHDGDRAHLVVGYRFAGRLDGPARRILDPERLSWSQVSDIDMGRRHTTVRMVPDGYVGLLTFSGWYELRDMGTHCCHQHLEADLRVHVPLLGPLAERALAGSIGDNLAATAALVERWARERGNCS